MLLDDLVRFRELDMHDMRRHLDSLPDQVEAGWGQGQILPVPESFHTAERIVIAAMGSSALAGDLLAALTADSCTVPIIVNRGYELPAYVNGPKTLVIAISCSGSTEETLSALELATARGAQLLVLTADGDFAQHAETHGTTVWHFDHEGQSRAALGWIFGLLLALVNRLGLVPDLSVDVVDAIEAVRGRITLLGIDGRIARNPAKRLAGQLIGRIPVIYGSGIMAPVARRWKGQLNENAKTWAQWDALPEINHNASAGIIFPRPLMTKVSVVILASPQYDHPRVIMRQTLTKDQYLQQGIAVDTIKMRGTTRLSQMLGGVQYGDYVSYYVAMCYEVDPTPTQSVAELKERLAAAGDLIHDSHD
ncbi:MAG: bifunctional phosphoglucose/phosphomannose isomerase [Chloroflexota bacterium]